MTANDDRVNRLADWLEEEASVPLPPMGLEAILDATRDLKPRPAVIAGIGSGWVGGGSITVVGRWTTLHPVLLVALIVLLAAALVGGVVFTGGQLTRDARSSTNDATSSPVAPTPRELRGLIMVRPEDHGEIRVMRPDGELVGAVTVRLAEPSGCGDRVALTADGRRVAYWSTMNRLTIAPLDGSGPVTVPDLAGERTGQAFSPDRSRVAVLSHLSSGRSDLTIISLVDGTATVIARDLENAASLDWSSADTLAIGYLSDTEVGIDVMGADGTAHRPLVRHQRATSQADAAPILSWSPDGARIVYSDDVGGGSSRVVELATGKSTAVAMADGTPVNAWRPVQNSLSFRWSPDGRSVAYRTGSAPEFVILDLVTGETRALPHTASASRSQPRWSPDGSRLAFGTDGGLTTVRADLSGRVDQNLGPGVRSFAWSPDSRQIAVLMDEGVDLYDPEGIAGPTRISNEAPSDRYSCLSWSSIDAP